MKYYFALKQKKYIMLVGLIAYPGESRHAIVEI